MGLVLDLEGGIIGPMHRGFRFRLYPTAEQAETLGQWVGVTRLVYNLALEQRRDFWRQFQAAHGKRISLYSQGLELTALRAAHVWVAAVPQSCLEAALFDLEQSFAAFFKGASGFPTPRTLGRHDSIRFRARDAQIERIDHKWGRVRVPKLGWVLLRMSRDLVGRSLTVGVRRAAGQWHVTVTADVGAPPAMNGLPGVGVDRGVANTLSLSNGQHVRLPDMSALERRRRKHQKVLARRKRGSRRYAKQRQRVARVSAQIARTRAHHLHVASADIASRFGAVALEELKIGNMTRAGRGKRGLNRSILHQGWGAFAQMLDYKLEAAGGRLVYVPASYTSQTCAGCGVVDARSRKSQAAFECVHCGHIAHADTNAAVEILRRSTAVVEGMALGRPDEARTLAA